MDNLKSIHIFLLALLFISPNSFASARILKKEIIYVSPASGKVNLVWGVNNWGTPDYFDKKTTKLQKGLLYTSLTKDKNTFRTFVNVPFGATIDFVFQTTSTNKNKRVDIWDNNGAEGIDYHFTVTDEEPIVIKANFYSEKPGTGLHNRAWIILGLSIILPLLYFILRYFKKTAKVAVSYSYWLLLVSLCLFLFHVLARFEIIAHFPRNSFEFLSYYKPVFAANIYDVLYIGILSAAFLLPILLLKNKKWQRVVFLLYCILAVLSLSFSIINITAVHYLGRPFNYQWLYYSGFLGSTEAKNAVIETGLFLMIRTIIILCCALFLMAFSFVLLLNVLASRTKPLYVLLVLIIPLPAFTFYQSANSMDKFEIGKRENAVSSFLFSMITSYNNPSFYEMDIPSEYKYIKKADKGKDTLLTQYAEIKNVVLIVLESAGAEYFDSYGGTYSITPNITKKAGQTLLFEQAYSSAPASNKSLVSILCSMYPWVSYKSLTQEAPNFKRPSLSSVLHDAGYKTSFFTSADSRFQNGNAFLSYRDFDIVADFKKINCKEHYSFNSSTYKDGSGIDDYCLVNRLVNWLDETGKDPFFTMLWTNQAHYPYFVSDDEIDYGVENHNLNRYLNAIHHYDQVIGALFKVLKQKNLEANTLVVIVGDHGEAFGQHKQFGHATKLYEENIKVPLLFIHPKFSGTRNSSISGLKDIASTILPILGHKNPEVWQGRNLLGSNNEEAFYFAPWSDYLFSYRKDTMKYIFDETNKKIEVFNLKTDKNETKNLASKFTSEQLDPVRYRIASWVQYQDSVVKKLIKK